MHTSNDTDPSILFNQCNFQHAETDNHKENVSYGECRNTASALIALIQSCAVCILNGLVYLSHMNISNDVQCV